MADIRRQLDNLYAQKRDKALREAENRKNKIYDKIPELGLIETKITMAGIKYAKAVISNSGQSPDIEELVQNIAMLNNRKNELLKENNLPLDCLEPKFSCDICEDMGYVPDSSGALIPCSCYQKLYLKELYAFSNLLDDGNTGFEFFDISYFSGKTDKKRYNADISPREQILSIKQKCIDFINEFDNVQTPNLYFFGPTGTGKTFMAKSVGLELLKKGYSVLYMTANTLFSIIRQYRFNIDNTEINADQAYKNLITSNLLILDDLGTEPGSDSRYAELLTLLETRKSANTRYPIKTIISSNLDLKRLFQEYNERIASRIVGEFDTLQFIGDDIRIIKKISG